MKKKILTLVALCAVITANATILRVSNVNGSTAPYQTIQAAHDAANVGDTIMVDGSNNSYGETEIGKTLVLIGPGYWVHQNGLADEAVPSATANFVILHSAPGTVIEGFNLGYDINRCISICADGCVIRRCKFTSGGEVAIWFKREKQNDKYLADPAGAVIHQNFFKNCGIKTREMSGLMSNVQITNNIFVHDNGTEYDIQAMTNSYIGYNTMLGGGSWGPLAWVWSSTIEHNIIRTNKIKYSNIHDVDNNEWGENVIAGGFSPEYSTDKDIYTLEQTLNEGKDCGAFAGESSDNINVSPYVISGVPSAPVIQDLVVPTTVEAGKKMKVTIKLGIQK